MRSEITINIGVCGNIQKKIIRARKIVFGIMMYVPAKIANT